MQGRIRADDGGDAQGTGQNRRVGIRAACRRHEAQDLIRVELQRFAGSQVVGGDDDVVVFAEIDARSAAQLLFHATRYVEDIGGAGLHVGVVHRAEHFGKLLGRPVDGRFGVEHFIADLPFDRVDIIVVVQHHLVYFKHGGLFFAYFFQGFFI